MPESNENQVNSSATEFLSHSIEAPLDLYSEDTLTAIVAEVARGRLSRNIPLTQTELNCFLKDSYDESRKMGLSIEQSVNRLRRLIPAALVESKIAHAESDTVGLSKEGTRIDIKNVLRWQGNGEDLSLRERVSESYVKGTCGADSRVRHVRSETHLQGVISKGDIGLGDSALFGLLVVTRESIEPPSYTVVSLNESGQVVFRDKIEESEIKSEDILAAKIHEANRHASSWVVKMHPNSKEDPARDQTRQTPHSPYRGIC